MLDREITFGFTDTKIVHDLANSIFIVTLFMIDKFKMKQSLLFNIYNSFAQEKMNLPLVKKLNEELNKDIQKISAEYQKKNKHLRYLVRESGTEPLLRILVEGKDELEVKKEINTLSSNIKSILNV